MATLTPEFSASRAIREYAENYYLKAAANSTERTAGDSAIAASLVRWKRDIARHWESVHFGEASVETKGGQHHFQVQVFADPDSLRINSELNSTQILWPGALEKR